MAVDPLAASAIKLPAVATADPNPTGLGMFGHRDQLMRFMERANEISILSRTPVDCITPLAVAGHPTASVAAVPGATAGRQFAFKCPLCTLQYRTQAFLNDHMRHEHSILI